jgi:isocitrate dehydrogenase
MMNARCRCAEPMPQYWSEIMSEKPTIIYTKTDEAPALATHSFLPIIRAFVAPAGINVELSDISLASRIIANFNDYLNADQKIDDALSQLGELAKQPEANIIKLPNISASVPQLKAAIGELQASGYALPDYPEDPKSDDEKAIKQRYDKIKGSAVNPVLREGNSDRRAPKAVKEFARKNPHSMGAWDANSQTHVSTMSQGDFRSNEQSATITNACTVNIEHIGADGAVTPLKTGLDLIANEVIDASVMEKGALLSFLENEIADAKRTGVLFSLHMKATMMKVSDPIIFGHAVKIYFKDLFDKFGDTLERIGVDVQNGFGDLDSKMSALSESEQSAITDEIARIYEAQPALAMVDSDRGITNLHVPSDVIIDASMPAMIRSSGQMWNAAGKLQDAKATIPDSSYASVYQEVIGFCKTHGAFDPTTMGSVSNVGLMAQKAEEYGSHDKTFEMAKDGVVRVVDNSGNVLAQHSVKTGDIWRMCQVKDAPVQDWVKLAVRRARATNTPAVFWLDETRAHDAELIKKVKTYLNDHDTSGLEIHILAPQEATRFSLERIKEGLDTVSVTGNVLRDYLTDLFPILEVGTSAKMLSIVPLMNGGGLFETGAGGSAPKHVQQFEKENHLRWDSLGEFLALAVSLDHVGDRYNHSTASLLGRTLDDATTAYLMNNKSPSRKVHEIDNRGTHFYVAMYWADALSKQTDNAEIASRFAPLAANLHENETTIMGELNHVQGPSVDIGGYYFPNDVLATAAMRPSAVLNQIIDTF